MSKVITFEFEANLAGHPRFFATAHLRHEGSAMDTFQWAVDRIDTKEHLTPVDRSEIEVYLRQFKFAEIDRKFRTRLAWAA